MWTEEKLAELNAPMYDYNGKKLTEYEASQIQRKNEREIRHWKREEAALNAAGLDSSETSAKIKMWQHIQRDFIDQTGLKRQYDRELISAKSIAKPANSGIIRSVKFDDRQFGKKIGKHAADFGMQANTVEGRAKMKAVIGEIVDFADECVIGEWRCQTEPVTFYIKGSDVVVTKGNNEFVTILKDGVENARVKKARGQ